MQVNRTGLGIHTHIQQIAENTGKISYQ